MRRKEYMKRGEKKLERGQKRMNPIGARGREKKKAKAAAIVLYFSKHGYLGRARCQMSNEEIQLGVDLVDPCHKKRASQGGGEAPENLVVAKRAAHDWQHSNREAEDFLAGCDVNVLTGGVVPWPPHLKQELDEWMRNWKGPR